MNKIMTLTALAAMFAATATAQTSKKPAAGSAGFKTTPKGLEYKFTKDEPGTPAKAGDFLDFHISLRIGDSIIYESRKINNDQPVPYQVQQVAFNGDLAEGFLMMSPGDIADFRVPVDTLIKAGQQFPPWVKQGEGMKAEFAVEMVSVKSPEQKRIEAETQAAKQVEIDDKLLQDYFKVNSIKPTKTASGMYYKIDKMGTGEKPAPGDSVSMNYTGKLLNGTTFDSNVDPAFQHVQPFIFVLGMGMVIRGWDEGIALLPKGTKATLYIPSGMAYGPQARGPQIPANSVMVFDVEVVDVIKKQ